MGAGVGVVVAAGVVEAVVVADVELLLPLPLRPPPLPDLLITIQSEALGYQLQHKKIEV